MCSCSDKRWYVCSSIVEGVFESVAVEEEGLVLDEREGSRISTLRRRCLFSRVNAAI